MSDMAAIILAAGKGTRMKSKLPKALHPLCGKAMTRFIIDACRESGIDDCIVVVGHGAEQVQEGLGSDVRYAVQEEQRGTGHACMQTMALLDGVEGSVLVTPGDTPLVTSSILSKLISQHESTGDDATVLTAVLDDAGHYGRVVRDGDGCVTGIVEAKDASPEQKKIGEINTAIYCFKLPLLRKYLTKITPANAQGEFYLTDVIGLMAADGLKVGAVVSEDPDVVLGINNRVDLAYLTGIIRRKIINQLMIDGVTVIDPDSTYVDVGVQIGQDTTLYPQTTIEGKSIIGEGCVIGPSTRLMDAELGNEVTAQFSNIAESTVGDGTRIGPFAHLRPGCKIGKKVKIGNFVEGKKAVLGDNVSAGHLTYLGDAEVGERTNIGAGTITCNYDGYAKFKTIIGSNVFVGSHTTFVAPVEIGDGALTAAGTVVTADVPEDALVIARTPQSVKEGWAKARREQKEQK
ncbi:MAG: bifunctional UDP-N-acetylglucosamine diphosphorylase/glucosamine-1-phosphate N-acetyltransferase GlmU [Armatimonadota bacterium]